MLKSIRGLMGSWFVVILMGILIASFAIFGIGDIFRSGGDANVIASVGEKELSPNDFKRAYDRRLDIIKQQSGQAVDPALAASLGLPQQILTQMVGTLTLEVAGEDLGIRTTDEQLAKAIRDTKAFQGPSGAFDQQTYERLLGPAGYTPLTYEKEVRTSMVQSQLIESLFGDQLPLQPMADNLFVYAQERREGGVFIFQVNEIKTAFTPTDADLQTWYKKHADQFRLPEYRGFAFIELTPDMYADGVTLAEDDVKKAYAQRALEFKLPERRTLDFASFPSEAAAKSAGADVAFKEVGNFTFEEVKQSYGADAAGQIFALDAGETTTPIQSNFGWALFKVAKIDAESVRPLDEVREQVEGDLKKEKALEGLYAAVSRAEEQASGGASLDTIAAALRATVKKVAAVAADGTAPEGAQNDPAAVTHAAEAFARQPKEALEMIEGQDGSYHMIEVRSVVPAKPRALADVKAEVTAAWVQEQRRAAAEKLAHDAIGKVKAGATPEDIAKELGAKYAALPPLTRDLDQNRTGVPDNIRDALFRQKPNTPEVVKGPSEAVYFTVVTTKITPGNPKENPAALAAYSQRLGQEFANDLVGLYVNALQKKYGKVTYPEKLKLLFPTGEKAN